MQEVWKAIPDYEGLYEVSNQGRVRTTGIAKLVNNKWGGKNLRICAVVVLTPSIDARKRCSVGLWKNGKTVRKHVHTLVAAAFIGPRPKGLLVLHGDGNPSNNKVKNLRYGSGCDNAEDARKHGTLMQGERHYKTKLAAKDVAYIRFSEKTGVCLAKEFGVTPAAISAIRTRKNWGSI